MRRQLRATRRALTALLATPLLIGAVALQGLIVGPILRNRTAIPNLIFNTMRKLIGLKVEFNQNSAEIEKKKPTWFVANHMSMADFVVAGSALNGNFVGKGEIMKWPIIGQLASAMKMIGVRRSREFNKESIGKIATAFNKGQNVIMFPEGTTNDGSRVDRFRAGLITMLFDETGVDKKGCDVPLSQDVVVQPISIRVKEVEGKDALNDPELRAFYSRFAEDDMLKRIWNRMGTKSMTIEVQSFPTMDPKNYKDQFELINAAHKQVQQVVAPNQKDIETSAIPVLANA
jgi:1-acyl-sn-glycerol-3-phosphate acyltransferase